MPQTKASPGSGQEGPPHPVELHPAQLLLLFPVCGFRTCSSCCSYRIKAQQAPVIQAFTNRHGPFLCPPNLPFQCSHGWGGNWTGQGLPGGSPSLNSLFHSFHKCFQGLLGLDTGYMARMDTARIQMIYRVLTIQQGVDGGACEG